MRGFTVVIPTYNGSKRLPLVLDKLYSQINIEELSWEVIVVDNNSQDETEKVIR
ncbi:MAG: glycosyltransferase, partial [Trichodesmium sp. St19_bin1]|nr:glycosyltransferase [Trichodesmium sp. St19_bin1]